MTIELEHLFSVERRSGSVSKLFYVVAEDVQSALERVIELMEISSEDQQCGEWRVVSLGEVIV